MTKKILLLLISASLWLSCSRRDDKYQEYVDDKYQTSENKQQSEQNKEDAASKKLNPKPKPEVVISPLEANQHIGRFVAVRGYIAEVNKRERVAYLNFVESYPKTPFTGVIFAGDFDKLGDLSRFLHKDVEVTGIISVYRNKPQIIINDESQIKIIK
jgi:DNA/RNA endonuclease YhcR with UshA esterase domain